MAKPERAWLKNIRVRAKRVVDAVDNRVTQLRYGSFEKQRAEMFRRIREVQGGKEALQAAEDQNAEIRVVAAREIDGVKGRFSPRKRRPLVRVSSNGDMPRMVTTLWHELRHLQQHLSRGDLEGGSTSLLDARVQHMTKLMMETDAFTSQTLMCLRQKKLGHPQYLEAFLKPNSTAVVSIRAFLKERPYESFKDDAQFSRALFANILQKGMAGYSQKYFDFFHKIFDGLKDAGDLRAVLAARKPSPEFIASNDLLDIYGGKTAPLRPLAKKAFRRQPQQVRDTLTLIEDTVTKAPSLTNAEFTAAKAEILSRTKSLAKAFEKAKARGAKAPKKLPAPKFKP